MKMGIGNKYTNGLVPALEELMILAGSAYGHCMKNVTDRIWT